MNKINDSFSIIPHTILFNINLNSSEKLLYCYISTLSNKDGFCFATNKYLAKKFKVTPRCINIWLNKLEEQKLIRAEYIYDKKEIIQRKLYPYPSNNRYPSRNNFQESNEKNFKYNNINKNNKNTLYANKDFKTFENNRTYADEEFESLYNN